jgi:hypothetical protein
MAARIPALSNSQCHQAKKRAMNPTFGLEAIPKTAGPISIRREDFLFVDQPVEKRVRENPGQARS